MSKLLDARCRIQIIDIWYGVFSVRLNWIEDKSVGTMGVSIHSGGKVSCYYNPEWCEKHTIEELMAVIKHEIEHITRMHVGHVGRLNSSDRYKHDIYNMAADWVINGYYDQGRRDKHHGIKDLPKDGCYLPDRNDPQWAGVDMTPVTTSATTEELYEFLLKNTNKVPLGGGSGSGNGYNVVITANGKILSTTLTDNHAIWDKSNATAEEMRQTAQDMCRAASQAAGTMPSHLTTSIKALEKPQYNWVNALASYVGRHAGKKRLTYSRVNRRFRKFGIKGRSSHGNIPLTVHVDRSGSMSMQMLCRVFAEIEAMSQHFKITMLVFDAIVHSAGPYHKGDWKKIKLKGGGGTDFECSIAYAEEHNLTGQVNILITDGFDRCPAKREYPMMWVVIGKHGQDHFRESATWGEIIPIKDVNANVS